MHYSIQNPKDRRKIEPMSCFLQAASHSSIDLLDQHYSSSGTADQHQLRPSGEVPTGLMGRHITSLPCSTAMSPRSFCDPFMNVCLIQFAFDSSQPLN